MKIERIVRFLHEQNLIGGADADWLVMALRNFLCELHMCFRRTILRRDNKMSPGQAWEHLEQTIHHIRSGDYYCYAVTGHWPNLQINEAQDQRR